MITSIGAAAILILLVVAASVRRRGRARMLGRIRAAWGQPVARARQVDAAAASHRSRISQLDEARSLDDRTWRDLDLDDVFAALDRTEKYARTARAVPPTEDRADRRRSRRIRTAGRPLREGHTTARTSADSTLPSPGSARLQPVVARHPECRRNSPAYVLFPVLSAGTSGVRSAGAVLASSATRTGRSCPGQPRGPLSHRLSDWHTRRRLSAAGACHCDRGDSADFSDIRRSHPRRFARVGYTTPPSLENDRALDHGRTAAAAGRPACSSCWSTMSSSSFTNTLNLLLLLDACGVYFGAGELRRHGAALLRVTVCGRRS